MDISKKDWKLFRERLSGWQENYMEGLVKEYANFLNDDKKPASEKFWELEKRIKEDKHYPGVIIEILMNERYVGAYGIGVFFFRKCRPDSDHIKMLFNYTYIVTKKKSCRTNPEIGGIYVRSNFRRYYRKSI